MKTPFFLISEERLHANVNDYLDALALIWPNSQLSYSVKTNSLPWLLKYLHKQNVYAEVVSDEEYDLAKMCGYPDGHIVFNGPIKSPDYLQEAIQGGTLANLDSQSDLDTFLSMEFSDISNVGIRINVDVSVFDPVDIGYTENGFRFGFCEENGQLAHVIERIREHHPNQSFGLHFHCNSVTRSLGVYETISSYANKIIQKYKLTPSYIDMGGGFFGGVEGKPTARQYISLIREVLSKTVDINKTKLILEPGSAIIGSVADLYTTVLDAKNMERARIVTTDGSRIHIDPLWAKSRYMYSIESKSKKIASKQVICGYTCMDHDRLMVLDGDVQLEIGDKIIYHRVGAYSITFGGMFIRYLPDVYVEHFDGGYERIRSRISVEQYYRLQSDDEKM